MQPARATVTMAHSLAHSLALAALGGLAMLVLAACTSSGPGAPSGTTTTTRTVTGTRTVAPTGRQTAPVRSAPTTATRTASCPLLGTEQAADQVGMRLARITVLRSDGAVVGCRFYALQGSPLSQSEHLPGPTQPAVEIETTRYRNPVAAHNAFVLEARDGRNPQQFTVSVDNTGVCFQIPFYRPDAGRDWACAYSLGDRAVVVRTVVVSPALNVEQVARVVAHRLQNS